MSGDRELLAAWSAGDRRAGNQLFHRHFDAIFRFFHGKVSGGVDDLVQRTFLALVERADRLPADVEVRPYLFGIARNMLYRRLRELCRDGRHFDALETSVADVAGSPSQIADQREQLRLLHAALQAIPVDYQIVLELYFWEEMPAAEIAVVLELPEGTVRSRIRRAKELLREALAARATPAILESTIADLGAWALRLRDQVGRS
ncbi:MAG: sigma-70 family RNA polymerase sigma factor [Myxococcales bacterium]|nr:sigma-70 family RNA polymerase sigma factor [Myxococcales bacterium]MCB9703539.1 sigma-70 family RNA polymerase sigma factor [Myxococcales bacterium]